MASIASPRRNGSARVGRKLRKRAFLSWLMYWDNSSSVDLHRAGTQIKRCISGSAHGKWETALFHGGSVLFTHCRVVYPGSRTCPAGIQGVYPGCIRRVYTGYVHGYVQGVR